jgi:hypothetical protein
MQQEQSDWSSMPQQNLQLCITRQVSSYIVHISFLGLIQHDDLVNSTEVVHVAVVDTLKTGFALYVIQCPPPF